MNINYHDEIPFLMYESRDERVHKRSREKRLRENNSTIIFVHGWVVYRKENICVNILQHKPIIQKVVI